MWAQNDFPIDEWRFSAPCRMWAWRTEKSSWPWCESCLTFMSTKYNSTMWPSAINEAEVHTKRIVNILSLVSVRCRYPAPDIKLLKFSGNPSSKRPTAFFPHASILLKYKFLRAASSTWMSSERQAVISSISVSVQRGPLHVRSASDYTSLSIY